MFRSCSSDRRPGGMVGVAVGDEDGVHVLEVAPDARQQRP
jgi:hypothetical protein